MTSARLAAAGIVALVALGPTGSSATVSNDQVLSQHIREADGTSGQNTNSGAGVKTNHIQDGAVTARKLGVVCLDGEYLQYTMFAGWTCAVGTPGPTGPQGPVGPQGPPGVAPRYAGVVVVGVGADYPDLRSAMASIGDASETKRYLIKVLPGVYEMGPPAVEVKAYVDIEGSGKDVTKILHWSDGTSQGGVIWFRSTTPNELRDITLESRASGNYRQNYSVDGAVVTSSDGTAYLTNVRLVSVDAIYGVGFNGMGSNTHTGNSVLKNVEIVVSETKDIHALTGGNTAKMGVWVNAENVLTLDGVTIDVQGGMTNIGVYMQGYQGMTIRNTNVRADQYGLQAGVFGVGSYQPMDPVKAFHSQFRGATCGVSVNNVVQPARFLSQGIQVDGPLCITPGTKVRMSQSVDGTFAPMADLLQ